MSPLVREQIRALVANFDGKVYILRDNGDTAIVLVDPQDRGPFPRTSDPEDAWKRVTEPCLMLIDPARAGYPRVVN